MRNRRRRRLPCSGEELLRSFFLDEVGGTAAEEDEQEGDALLPKTRSAGNVKGEGRNLSKRRRFFTLLVVKVSAN